MDISKLHRWFDLHKIEAESKFAVAVSGGPDSMALAGMMIEWAKDHPENLHFLTVDHGLREAAKDEARMVGQWLGNQNLKHQILIWEGDKPDSSIMEMARTARYDLMAQYCQAHQIPYLLVAHHQDDQAETFLIRLSKGSGLDGLSAMREVREYSEHLKILRPLLDEAKQDLVSYCAERDIPFVNDPSNKNVDYMRPRLRQSMEILAGEGLTAKRLALTAKRLSRARTALRELTQSALQSACLAITLDKISFDYKILQQYPEEINLRVLQTSLERFRPEAEYQVRMEKLEDLFEALWQDPQSFKPRTLGGCIISLKKDVLMVEKEHS